MTKDNKRTCTIGKLHTDGGSVINIQMKEAEWGELQAKPFFQELIKYFNGEPETKIFFLCDGDAPDCSKKNCYKNGEDGWCRWTSDINHAKNFKKREQRCVDVFYEDGHNADTLWP